MTINDLPEEDKEELLGLLREDILRSYHSGELKERIDGEYVVVEEGLTDEEVSMRYNSDCYWSRQFIEEYLLRWESENKPK